MFVCTPRRSRAKQIWLPCNAENTTCCDFMRPRAARATQRDQQTERKMAAWRTNVVHNFVGCDNLVQNRGVEV
jgi:hypothetical protein